ncbi:hypothetical protein [Marinobacter sp.]|uniref:hypothetical protein n=1 Tax=Marinobacter sp. TaxID=50741 RepID=UPI0023538A8D|nr:hypothetical protein [Marinobacter sp.]
MWHVEIPPTSPDRGIGGSLVVVDRLLAGVAISVVRFARESFPCGEIPFAGKYRSKVPFWGRTGNKLISFYVNVNLQKLINLSGRFETAASTCGST